jgi:hypothetical protein
MEGAVVSYRNLLFCLWDTDYPEQETSDLIWMLDIFILNLTHPSAKLTTCYANGKNSHLKSITQSIKTEN